ncbi:hypothetical protein [Ornithinimicrobium kibberense]|uniref:hypothetical protein n=1 Tax=Ornithinimicrobium kibberense TaxID=282060 RepID=UPI00360C599A
MPCTCSTSVRRWPRRPTSSPARRSTAAAGRTSGRPRGCCGRSSPGGPVRWPSPSGCCSSTTTRWPPPVSPSCS